MIDELTHSYKQLFLDEGIRMITAGEPLPEILYHYTSVESCFAIINVPPMSWRGPALWASCALGMNDAGEIDYGLAVVTNVVAGYLQKEQEVDDPFNRPLHDLTSSFELSSMANACIACFCDGADLLSQWRAYGKDSNGYSIGFRRKLLSEAGNVAGFKLFPVVYDRKHQYAVTQMLFNTATEILRKEPLLPDRLIWRAAYDTATELSLAFKHESFKEEREWRLISLAPGQMKYRAARWGIVPYVEIELPRDCLAEIWSGPTLNPVTRTTLEMYLGKTYGFRNKDREPVVPVRASNIPLQKL